jgi:hypothetical protein
MIADAHEGEDVFADGIVSVAQECLEMLGVVLFVEALMTYMTIERLAVTIGPSGPCDSCVPNRRATGGGHA